MAQVLDHDGDLLLVVVGQVVQALGDLAGLLARWSTAMTSGENWPEAARATLSSLPCMTLLPGVADGLADRRHGHHAGGQVDRAADVDAGVEQGRERAGEPAGVELAEERAEDRA